MTDARKARRIARRTLKLETSRKPKPAAVADLEARQPAFNPCSFAAWTEPRNFVHSLDRSSYHVASKRLYKVGPAPILAGPNRDRQFGHTDPIGPDHHGPESRWKKQARRRARHTVAASRAEA